MTGIGMSTASDSLDMHLGREIRKPLTEEDELRLAQFVMRNARIHTTKTGARKKMPLLKLV